MRVGFLGAAHFHAFGDARNVVAAGADIVGVAPLGDPAEPAECERWSIEFGAPVFADAAALLAERPDLVIVTVRPAQVADAVVAVDGRAPVFVNKVAAVDDAGLASLDELDPAAFGTASVLRFAPAVLALRTRLACSRIDTVRVLAQHDAAPFRTAERAWQDDPTRGGGTLLTVGVHAWELLDAVLPGARVVSVAGSLVAGRTGALSEDAAIVTAEVDHHGRRVPVQLVVSGVPGGDRYELDLVTDGGIDGVRLDDTGDANTELGFMGAIEAAIDAARDGDALRDWSSSSVVVHNAVLTAAALRCETKAMA